MVTKEQIETLKKKLDECEKAAKIAELTLRLTKAFLVAVEKEEKARRGDVSYKGEKLSKE
uniref:Uncharacterized protein n=1 Tax=viral metagenome TaxID=1070528 RepID=A0A6M3JUH2_9ZZZZ